MSSGMVLYRRLEQVFPGRQFKKNENFQLTQASQTYRNSKIACGNVGAFLASIHSDAENTFAISEFF